MPSSPAPWSGSRAAFLVAAGIGLTAAALLASAPGATLADGPAPDSSASEPEGHAGLEIDTNSRYVWRGLVLSPREVLQPSGWVGWAGTTLTVWGNLGVRGPEATGLGEVDVTLGHERTLGGFTFAPSALAYFYPNEADANSGELQLTISHALPPGLVASALASVDVVDHRDAAFYGATLGWEHTLAGAAVSAGARYGHGSPRFVTAYLSDEPRGLDLVGGAISVELVAGGLTMRPHLELDRPVGANSRALLPDDLPVVFGLAVGREF